MSDLAATNCGCGCDDNCGAWLIRRRMQLHHLDPAFDELLRKRQYLWRK